jgi:hypothetical protein
MGDDNAMDKVKGKAKKAMGTGDRRRHAEAGKARAAEQGARKQADEIEANGPMESIRRDDTK